MRTQAMMTLEKAIYRGTGVIARVNEAGGDLKVQTVIVI